jgi:hypothetical protein
MRQQQPFSAVLRGRLRNENGSRALAALPNNIRTKQT